MGAGGSGLVSKMSLLGQETRRVCLRRRYVLRTINISSARATITEAATMPPTAPPESWPDVLAAEALLALALGVGDEVVVMRTTDRDVPGEELDSSVVEWLLVDEVVVDGVMEVDD